MTQPIPEMPEMMTKSEYVRAQTELDRVAQLECAGSLFRTGELEATHLHHVRIAVCHHRDIHAENRSEYKNLISGLVQYGLNGNSAAYDRNRKPSKLSKGDIELSEYFLRKRVQ